MGILNITPDSFYDGSRFSLTDNYLETAGGMIADGAHILDIGGYSTRPGAADISIEEECARVLPVISAIRKAFPEILISIDTFRAEVARRAVEAGASMINDVAGGTLDNDMFRTVAALGCPYILMHMKGTPQTMQSETHYRSLFGDIYASFSEKIRELRAYGVKDIILDPGFGFAKATRQNYELMGYLDQFHALGCPLLVGVSRKSMIWRELEITPETALNGTTVLNTIALRKGASILRVHDVREATQAIRLHALVS